MAALWASAPQVKGDWESRLPWRSTSAGPLHGSSKARVAVPLRLRDHTGLAAPAGPGQMSTWSSAPIMKQSKNWWRRSPSAENITTFRRFADQLPTLASAATTSFLIESYMPVATVCRVFSSVMTVPCATPTGTLFVERPLHTMCGSLQIPPSW